MPKVKITNLKFGACVINSLRLTIPGKASVIRDSSIIGDPDLSELESEGIISLESLDDPKVPPMARPQPAQTVKSQPASKGKATQKTVGTAQKGKAQGANATADYIASRLAEQKAKPPAAKPKMKPGTDFRAVDGPEDDMGRKVVVMGEHGPVVKNMGPGINAQGPKYVGDDAEDSDPPDAPAEGFTDV